MRYHYTTLYLHLRRALGACKLVHICETFATSPGFEPRRLSRRVSCVTTTLMGVSSHSFAHYALWGCVFCVTGGTHIFPRLLYLQVGSTKLTPYLVPKGSQLQLPLRVQGRPLQSLKSTTTPLFLSVAVVLLRSPSSRRQPDGRDTTVSIRLLVQVRQASHQALRGG